MKQLIQLFVIMAVCFSCKDDQTFDISPAERAANHIGELRKELVGAPYGWAVTYFPRTDSLLFSNPGQQVRIPREGFSDKYGYGGHFFLMKFAENGTVETVADYNEHSLKESKSSEFEINRNSSTQLSFTTFNYLHRLVNDRFSGSMDFLYTGKDADGNLVFKTTRYVEPAREYILFSKLKEEKAWTETIDRAYKNKIFFERMKNPQLIIRKAGRVYFRSDMPMRPSLPGTGQRPEIAQRYHLFLSIAYYAPQGWTQEIVTGLGSGYVGTFEGLTFRPGIRYNKNYIFYDFRREENRFVCELVKVFDPYTKTERWVSKHLAPHGEETGVVAEIWDEK